MAQFQIVMKFLWEFFTLLYIYFTLYFREFLLQFVFNFPLPINVFDDEVLVIYWDDFNVLMGIEGFFMIFIFPVQYFLFIRLPLFADFEVFGLTFIDHIGIKLSKFLFIHVDGGDGSFVLEVVVLDVFDEAFVDFFERFSFLHWKLKLKIEKRLGMAAHPFL